MGSCYTGFVLKNITITVTEETARWARRQAAEENTSISKLVGRLLEEHRRQHDGYWRAYEKWKDIQAVPGIDADNRLTREQAHGRR